MLDTGIVFIVYFIFKYNDEAKRIKKFLRLITIIN